MELTAAGLFRIFTGFPFDRYTVMAWRTNAVQRYNKQSSHELIFYAIDPDKLKKEFYIRCVRNRYQLYS